MARWLALYIVVVVFTGAAAETERGNLVYYLDQENLCGLDEVILAPGQTATLKEARPAGNEYKTDAGEECNISFGCPTGFNVMFVTGEIFDCGVTIAIHEGNSTGAIIQSFTCGDHVGSTAYRWYKHITFSLTKQNPRINNYKFDVKIAGRTEVTEHRDQPDTKILSPGVIAAVSLSVMTVLALVIVIPMRIRKYLHEKRQEPAHTLSYQRQE